MNPTKPAKCPIKGCNLEFSKGILGWHKHVERVDAHPYWHPDILPGEVRKELFVAEYPDFFLQAVGHQTPAAIRLSTKPPTASPPPDTPSETPTAKKVSPPPMPPSTPRPEMLILPVANGKHSRPPEPTVVEVLNRIMDLLVVLEARVR